MNLLILTYKSKYSEFVKSFDLENLHSVKNNQPDHYSNLQVYENLKGQFKVGRNKRQEFKWTVLTCFLVNFHVNTLKISGLF